MQYRVAIVDDNTDDIFTIKRLLSKADNKYIIFDYTNPDVAAHVA